MIKKDKKSQKLFLKIPTWLLPWIIIAGLVIMAGGLLIPTKVTAYQIEIPYIDKEQYVIDVPYEDIEEYTVQVPYETTETYVESVPVTTQQAYQETEYYYVDQTNWDNEIVNQVDCDYTPGCTCTHTSWWSGRCDQCNCRIGTIQQVQQSRIVTKYKPVTTYKDVIKERTVTKYRDETKYQKVTRIRQETREREVQKIRLERQYKEVNWLFGFNALIKLRKNLPSPEVLS